MWYDNIEMDVWEIWYEVVEWIELTQNMI